MAFEEFEEFEFDEVPVPPRLPVPSLWLALLQLDAGLFCVGVMMAAPGAIARWTGFLAGAVAVTSTMLFLRTLQSRRKTREMQAEMQATYDHVKDLTKVVPVLFDRYGPAMTVELVNQAQYLVMVGDFADIRQAVHSIEQHLDREPTLFENGS